jgi:TPP-dependent indolepyruvate ferredoxin oxidoreductase alpha subunit
MRIMGHLIATGCRTFWRILFTAVFAAALAAGVAVLVAYAGTRQWPPTQLTDVAAGAFAVLTAYAAGVTVLLSESVKALVDAAKVVEREAVAPIKAVGRELEGNES